MFISNIYKFLFPFKMQGPCLWIKSKLINVCSSFWFFFKDIFSSVEGRLVQERLVLTLTAALKTIGLECRMQTGKALLDN